MGGGGLIQDLIRGGVTPRGSGKAGGGDCFKYKQNHC